VRYEAVRGFLMSDPAHAPRHFKRALGWLQPGAILRMTREFGASFESYLQFALFSQRMVIREEAMDAIDLLPEQRTPLLKRVLARTDDDGLRVRLLHRLFELEGKAMADDIKRYAAAGSLTTRIAAIRMLGKLKKDKGARELLIGNLSEPNPNIRIAAALTLVGG
jgi:HEAT repeat protein